MLRRTSGPGTFPIVVGTHPHDDHLRGMPEFLARYGQEVGEYWDPGYYFTGLRIRRDDDGARGREPVDPVRAADERLDPVRRHSSKSWCCPRASAFGTASTATGSRPTTPRSR